MDTVHMVSVGAPYLSSLGGDPVGSLSALYARPHGRDNLELWPGECRAMAGPRRARLTRREFQVLYDLASHPGRVLSKDLIHDMVWGTARPHPRDRWVDG